MDLAQLSKLQPPKLSQSVHREECTQCFDNQVRTHLRGVPIQVAIIIVVLAGRSAWDRCLFDVFQRWLS
jgi:hypothetical protein